MKIVTLYPDRCVGCKNCEYACAFMQQGDFSKNHAIMQVNYYPQAGICLPLTCAQCNDAPCMEICPAAAISRDPETNAVVIDPDRCAGCKMCILACPFGNINFDHVKLVSRKCNLCEGDPLCVKTCISGALVFEEVEDIEEEDLEKPDKYIENAIKRTQHSGGGK